jgi:hypothetical protein
MKTIKLILHVALLVGVSMNISSCKDDDAVVDNSARLIGKWVEFTYGKTDCVDATKNSENECTSNCDIYEFLNDGTFIYDFGSTKVTSTYEILHEYGRVIIDYGSSTVSYIFTFEGGNLVLNSPEYEVECGYKIVLIPFV